MNKENKGKHTYTNMKVTVTVVFLCFCAALFSMSHAKKKKKNKWSAIKDTINTLENKIKEVENEIENVRETCGCVKGCPDGWSEFQDSCLYFVETRMTWYQAILYCQSLGEFSLLPFISIFIVYI